MNVRGKRKERYEGNKDICVCVSRMTRGAHGEYTTHSMQSLVITAASGLLPPPRTPPPPLLHERR